MHDGLHKNHGQKLTNISKYTLNIYSCQSKVMLYDVIATFKNENHSYEVHTYHNIIANGEYYVVRKDGKQRWAFMMKTVR